MASDSFCQLLVQIETINYIRLNKENTYSGGAVVIIRKCKEAFVFIEQHDHARVSGDLFTYLADHLMVDSKWRKEVEFAIYQHDCGWIPFDQNPFWDDAKNEPFSFSSFPRSTKTVLYEYGINKVEKESKYAALLCSKHYSSFLDKHPNELVKQFVTNEKTRQSRLKEEIPLFDEDLFAKHSKLLTFFDDLSLYLCLNEPGVKKEKEHHFFTDGIQTPSYFGMDSLAVEWLSNNQLTVSDNIFKHNFTIELKQKVIPKSSILQMGLNEAYITAKEEKINITIKKSA